MSLSLASLREQLRRTVAKRHDLRVFARANGIDEDALNEVIDEDPEWKAAGIEHILAAKFGDDRLVIVEDNVHHRDRAAPNPQTAPPPRGTPSPQPTVHAAWRSLAENAELAWRLAACRAAHAPRLLNQLQTEGRVTVTARGGINEYLAPERKAELVAAVQAHLRSTADPWYSASPSTQLNYGGKGCGQQLWFTDDGTWRVTQPNRHMLKLHTELPSELPSSQAASVASASSSDVSVGGSSGGDSETDSEGERSKRRRRQSALGDDEDDEPFLPPMLEADLLQDIHLLPAPAVHHTTGANPLHAALPELARALDGPVEEEQSAVAAAEESGTTHDRIVQQGVLQLDAAQLREFVTHGVVSLPSFLTAAQLEHYRAQAWAQLAPEAHGGEDLLDGRGGGTNLSLTPSLDELPQVHALLQQLSDGKFTPEHEWEETQARCKVTLPASEVVPLPAPGTVSGGNVPLKNTVGHIDGYNRKWVGSARPAGAAGTMVTVVVYVEDAESHNPYCYWRGGCHRVHAFFRDQPHVVDGRFVRQDEFQQHGWARIYGGDAARSENVARAGDALVVHGWTPHVASRNMQSSRSPR